MNDATDPAEQRTPPGNPDNRPDAPGNSAKPPPTTDNDWEYYKRGPRRLASIGYPPSMRNTVRRSEGAQTCPILSRAVSVSDHRTRRLCG